MEAVLRDVDVAIVGFGFCGLSVLANLVARGRPRAVAVVADDLSGVGLAYSTPEPGHLLNVVAERMGALASDPGGFAAWLATAQGSRACAELGVRVPGPQDFAPRAIYGAYLTALRAGTLERARDSGVHVHWIQGRVERISPTEADGRWELDAGLGSRLVAQEVVLATGNETRSSFSPVTHRGLRELIARPPTGDPRPAVIIGTGLTAIDALITLRSHGFEGPVIAVSRTGLLPRAHHPNATSAVLGPDFVAQLDSASAVVRFVRRAEGAEGAVGADGADGVEDWRSRIDALRPHTSAIWQRLDPAAQASAIRRWSTYWSVHRHRMAPENAALIERELAAGTLSTLSISSVAAQRRPGGRLEVTLTPKRGRQQRLEVAALVDCTGTQLDVTASRQPLLTGLIQDELVAAHDTGWGLAADAQHRVGEHLYALGGLLAGQLWESIAVPELREQAAVVAAAVETRAPTRTAEHA